VPVVHLNGTTVTVTRLFHEIPSRREQVNKLAPFSRAKIRALVRTYALARPHVRFELLVKPGMGEVAMQEFLYVPHPTTPFILDAARKILGPEVASGLTVERALSARYAIVVLLPAKNHQIGKMAVIRRGEGQFLFIDGRPVTCKSGIGRLLVKVLREKLAVCPGWEKDAKDAVVIMDVRCAFRLYDVNIEPSKETVLFFDERDVAILLTEWFGRIFAAAEISQIDDQRVFS
jgi:DNA mismatch repair ATPase MutL